MDNIIYKSTDLNYKTPFGAVTVGTLVTFNIRVPKSMQVKQPRFFIVFDSEKPIEYKMKKNGKDGDCDLFTLAFTPKRTGPHFYWFDLYVDYTKIYRGYCGEGVLMQGDGDPFRLFVYEKNFTVPDWMPGGVMYQIFPDRFCDLVPDKVMPFSDRVYRADKKGEPYFWANELPEGHLNQDYFGGDFEGIRSKLPYLQKLGVTCIYLNPIFEAHSNHRYNTADYLHTDPILGSNEDFKTLCDDAKKLGIRIILDGVFSHTGDDSIYFDRHARYGQHGAYHNIDSPYRSWYLFSKDFPFGYKCWWGFASLPEVDETNPHFVNFICGKEGVIDYWRSMGAAGFRLDVADELPDEFIGEIRKAVKNRGEDGLLLGEVWEDATEKVSYEGRRKYLQGSHLDSVMNYPFKNAVIDFVKTGRANYAADELMKIVENYPKPAMSTAMNFLSNHDTIRAITEIAGDNIEDHDRYWQSRRHLTGDRLAYGKKLIRLAYAMLFTLPGVPCVYYGDEIFMQGYKDPFNRAFYNWEEEDNTLRRQIEDLSIFRKENDVFKEGDFEIISAEFQFLAYRRYDDKNEVLIAINRSGSLKKLEYKNKKFEISPYSYILENI